MSDEGTRVHPHPELSRAQTWMCARLGHSYPVRTVRAADVLRDDGEDHTYPGCVRCGTAMNERRWW